jgi:hypothetical protein
MLELVETAGITAAADTMDTADTMAAAAACSALAALSCDLRLLLKARS